MSDIVKVVVPSHLRAGRVTVFEHAMAPELATLVVAQGQAAAYAEHHPDVEIDTHPDDLLGLPAKRNWMYARYGSIFMLDDDTKFALHLEHTSGEGSWQCRLTGHEFHAVTQRLAAEARDLGLYLFGFGSSSDVRSYPDFLPYVLNGRVVGQSMGLLAGSGLTWHEGITAKTDYWMTLRNAHRHRIALVDRRYATVTAPVFTTPGGTAAHRTQDAERRDTEILRGHFGDAIRAKKRTPLAKAGKGHADQISLRIPW